VPLQGDAELTEDEQELALSKQRQTDISATVKAARSRQAPSRCPAGQARENGEESVHATFGSG
jgi:hypothetical protein